MQGRRNTKTERNDRETGKLNAMKGHDFKLQGNKQTDNDCNEATQKLIENKYKYEHGLRGNIIRRRTARNEKLKM